MTRKQANLIFYAAAGAVALILILLSILRHYRLATVQDLALFEQILWNIRQGHGAWTSMSGNSWLQFPHNFFGEHVSPILYLLAYPAGLTPGPEMLLVLQALAVVLAAFPAARIMEAETGRPWAGYAAGLAWLAFPALWGAVLFDFHMECFEPLFLFAFWLAFRRGARSCWLWALLYAACKEDAPVYLAALALAGGFVTGHRRLGVAVFAAAFAYALAAWFWIQPSCSPEGKALLGQRIMLPSSAGEIAAWVQAQFFKASRWQAIGAHLITFGWLPLFSGPAMLPWGISLCAMWLSNDFQQSHGMIHYPLTFYPLLFISAAIGLRQAGRWARSRGSLVRWTCWAVIIGSSLAGIVLGWASGSAAVGGAFGPGNDAALRSAPSVLASIPKDRAVVAARTLVAQIARRSDVRVLMEPVTNADWIATRLDGIVYPCKNHEEWLLNFLLSKDSPYGVYAVEPNLLAVFKRGHPKDLNRAVLEQQLCAVETENLLHQTGRTVRDGHALNGLALMFTPDDGNRFAAFGRYLDLPAGTYRVTFRIRTQMKQPRAIARLEVTENAGRSIRASRIVDEILPGYTDLALEAKLSGESRTEFRILKTGPGRLWADRIRWERLDDPPQQPPAQP